MTETVRLTVPPLKCYACDGKLDRNARAEVANIILESSHKTTHMRIEVPFCSECHEANRDNKEGILRFIVEGLHKHGDNSPSAEELRSLYLHPKRHG